MKTSVTLLLAAGCLVGLVAAEKSKRQLSVFDTFHVAREVPIPNKVEDLRWMVDLWICIDRALREPRTDFDTFRHLQTIDLREDGGSVSSPSDYGDGCRLLATCTLVGVYGSRGQGVTNLSTFNFYTKAKGITFGGPSADYLYLKRDPSDPPRWFILEHQVSGDVLLFQRSGTNATSTTKH